MSWSSAYQSTQTTTCYREESPKLVMPKELETRGNHMNKEGINHIPRIEPKIRTRIDESNHKSRTCTKLGRNPSTHKDLLALLPAHMGFHPTGHQRNRTTTTSKGAQEGDLPSSTSPVKCWPRAAPSASTPKRGDEQRPNPMAPAPMVSSGAGS